MQRRAREPNIRKIDFVFYNERTIRRRINEIRQDPSPNQKTSVKVLAFSDPTSLQAIRNATPIEKIAFEGHVLENPESWLEVVERTYEWAPEITKSIALSRYRGKDYRQICLKENVSKSTFYEKLNEFRRYAVMQAISKRLLTI